MSACVRCGKAEYRIWMVRLAAGLVCWPCDTRVCAHCGNKWEAHQSRTHRCPGAKRGQFAETRWRPARSPQDDQGGGR